MTCTVLRVRAGLNLARRVWLTPHAGRANGGLHRSWPPVVLLTTVVARVCLDMLRSRASRREEPFDGPLPEPAVSGEIGGDPEDQVLLADSVGIALLAVLGTLAPAERVAFVLHDMFAVPFDEVAAIVGRSPAAARQLASRARRRVQGADAVASGNQSRQREIVDAFLAAARGGGFEALLFFLHPGVVGRARQARVRVGAPAQGIGAPALPCSAGFQAPSGRSAASLTSSSASGSPTGRSPEST